MNKLYEKLPHQISVIGSFPFEMEIGYPYDPEDLRPEFKRWLEIQKKARVDFPCVQPHMVHMFLTDPNVEGLKRTNGGYELTDPSELNVRGPVQTEYLKLLQEIAEEIDYSPSGLVVPTTGPFTLSTNISIGGRKLITLEEGVRMVAEKLVSPILKYYSSEFDGFIIRQDEPGASRDSLTSGGVYRGSGFETNFLIEIWNQTHNQINPDNNIPAFHSCGPIGSLPIVLRKVYHLKLFSHEFFTAVGQKNLAKYSPENLEGRLLGYGIVENSSDIESKKEIDRRMQIGINKYGREKLHVHPSCGFGGLSGLLEELEEIIFRKLQLVDYARNIG